MRAEACATRPARAGAGAAAGAAPARPGWRLLTRILLAAAFGVVGWLLWRHAREVDWHAVFAALRDYSAATLLAAAGLAATSHALYCSYDLIGRRQVGHALPTPKVLATAFVSYAFNLNLGALVGGVALRYRLYSRLGLQAGTITQVVGLSMLSNWLGYLVLAAAVLLLWPPLLPPGWALGSAARQLFGVLLLGVAAAYLLLCFAARRRVWRLRGHDLRLPSGPTALLQLTLSCANWMVIAGIVSVLLNGRVDYPGVLAVLLVAAVAGVVTHVPAGLGVLEAVFVTLLSHRVAQAELLAALLAYRAIYYLGPLGLALGLYLALETRAKRGTGHAPCHARRSTP